MVVVAASGNWRLHPICGKGSSLSAGEGGVLWYYCTLCGLGVGLSGTVELGFTRHGALKNSPQLLRVGGSCR